MDRSDIRVDAVFDLETEDWDKLVFAGLLYSDGDYRSFTWKNTREFFDFIFAIQGDVWAHFGGGFDIKFVLDEALARGYPVKIASAGSLIRSAKIRKLTLRDSFALFPASLAAFTRGFGVSKQKLEIPCRCGAKCGGYCSIARDLPQFHPRIETYLEADCRSLLAALTGLRSWARAHDVDLRPTVGASAHRYAQRRFNVPDGELRGADFRFARSAYYGGRCEVFRWGVQSQVYEYDVRSMYPWALSETPLPWGNATRLRGHSDSLAAFEAGEPGAYDCEVTVPYMRIPPLPMRTKKRLYYPTGDFHGTWTLPALQYAIECGATIRRFRGALVWPETRVVFAHWAAEIFRLRHHEAGGADTPLGQFCKFMHNAETGKLGQNPDRWSHEINPDKIVTCECGAHEFEAGRRAHDICAVCTGHYTNKAHRAECRCNPHIELSRGIYKRRAFRMSGCMNPIWAAYLTSVSHVKLHRKLVEGGRDDAAMCDTDSVFALLPRESADPGSVVMGEFEHKGTYRECYFAAPKVYEKKGLMREAADGVHLCECRDCRDYGKIRAKGIKQPKELVAGRVYKSAGIVGFGQGTKPPPEGATGQFFRKGALSRKLKFHPGGRIVVDASGDTRPMTAAEALADSGKR